VRRATREWVSFVAHTGRDLGAREFLRDVLDSDARLRAENRELRKEQALWRRALADGLRRPAQLALSVEQLLNPTKPHYFDALTPKHPRKTR
jgi:hypothetical protein